MQDVMKEYHDYLVREQRQSGRGLWQLHQLVISREVARSYGLSEEQLKQLDEDL